jgi:hypothetical protein
VVEGGRREKASTPLQYTAARTLEAWKLRLFEEMRGGDISSHAPRKKLLLSRVEERGAGRVIYTILKRWRGGRNTMGIGLRISETASEEEIRRER